MEPIRSVDALQRHVGAVRRGTSAYASNLYAAPDQLERWCAAGRLSVVRADRAVLLLRADRAFHHVVHVAEDQAALVEALAMLPAGTYVTDLIGRGSALDAICATHAMAGFANHTVLQRMARVQMPGAVGGGEVIVAVPEDAPTVAALLDRLLDPFAEQVPDADELAREAAAGRLLIVRRDDAIAGMLLYEAKGRTAHLRLWHVDADARGAGVGRRLMTAFVERCAQAQRLILWVIADNDRSVAIYRHYGFAPDGLLDRIMILCKEPHL